MFCDFPYDTAFGVTVSPARQRLVACGYDKHCYISTAKLSPTAYTSQSLIEARLGGNFKLIESVDDSVPPVGDLSDSALTTFNSVVQNVTTEINGYLSSIYPIPLAQTGTVAVIKVSSVDSDGAITAIEVMTPGNYKTAPDTSNTVAYMRYVDPLANERVFGTDYDHDYQGTGAVLTVTYADVSFSDEDGTVATAKQVSGTPVIANAGTGYQEDELLVLVGGASFVPAKIRQAALDLICHSLYKRRLAPDEKNPFSGMASMWRKLLIDIGHGEQELDGTYKRMFSPGACWTSRSVIGNANSL